MIRPFTCLAVVLAASSGLYLYSEKHKTTLLDDRIRVIVDDTHRVEDRTSMLRAEWALLNQPDRLQALAARFLPTLQPIAPKQFVQLADLARHLPVIAAAPPAPAAAAPGPAAPEAAAPVLVAQAAPAMPVVQFAHKAAGPTAPLRLASASEVIAPSALSDDDAVAPASPAPEPVIAHVTPIHAIVRIHKTVAHRATVVASARPLVRVVSSYSAPAPMLAGAWRPATQAWRPAYSAPVAPAFTGSALGMAHLAMAPPMAPSP